MARNKIKVKKTIVTKRGKPAKASQGLLGTPVKKRARVVSVSDRRLKRILGK